MYGERGHVTNSTQYTQEVHGGKRRATLMPPSRGRNPVVAGARGSPRYGGPVGSRRVHAVGSHTFSASPLHQGILLTRLVTSRALHVPPTLRLLHRRRQKEAPVPPRSSGQSVSDRCRAKPLLATALVLARRYKRAVIILVDARVTLLRETPFSYENRQRKAPLDVKSVAIALGRRFTCGRSEQSPT